MYNPTKFDKFFSDIISHEHLVILKIIVVTNLCVDFIVIICIPY